MWRLWFPFFLIGCQEEQRNDPGSSGSTFETPWEASTPSGEQVSGDFRVALDNPMPGAGWFRTETIEGRDMARASLFTVEGATWPVVQIQILGWESAGWNTLELDVALNAWLAGAVPLDGEAAVGVLTHADGTVQYLLGGDLQISDAGFESGQRVAGRFEGVSLSEAQ